MTHWAKCSDCGKYTEGNGSPEMFCNCYPRRCRVDLATPAEAAIRAAIKAVEDMPPHVFLTEAVILLSQALNRVADFVDRRP